MKKKLLWLALVSCAATAAALGRRPPSKGAPASLGPDPLQVDPARYRQLLDNDFTRVLSFEAKPGAKVQRHFLMNTVAYSSAKGCKLRFIASPTDSRDVPFPAGDAVWLPWEAHEVEVIGDKPCRLLLVELKPPVCP
jgi:hypothetical protein